ncbi:MAG: T9SS type A sorting domain-containing protein [Saprospiraceae bacterium]
MRKCCFVMLIALFTATENQFAQQLTPFVVSTAGGFSSNGSGMLSFTAGEMSAVETYTASSNILTQGFQQAWDFSTAIHDNPLTGFFFEVYPNPSTGYFQFVSRSDREELITAKVMDILGKEIFQMEYEHKDGLHFEPIELTHLPQGIYLILVRVAGQHAHDAYQFVEKISIVR